MTNNKLKLNQEKTELIVISSRFRPRPALGYVSVGEQILPKPSARNLGAMFDRCCNMVKHVKIICKTSHYHLRNISKIRKYLTKGTTEIVGCPYCYVNLYDTHIDVIVLCTIILVSIPYLLE